MSKPMILCLTSVLAFSARTSVADEKSPVREQSTPQMAATGFVQAMSKKNWSGAFACLTDESQDLMLAVGGLHLALYRFAKPEEKQLLDAIVRKHKIAWDAKQQRPVNKALSDVKNKSALFGDLFDYVERKARRDKKGSPFSKSLYHLTTFMNFEIVGDHATADVFIMSRKQRLPVYLNHIGGKWYVDLVQGRRRIKTSPSTKGMP